MMKLNKTDKLPDAVARIGIDTYEWLLNHPKETFEVLYKHINPCTVLSVTNLAWGLFPKETALILCTHTIDMQLLFEYHFKKTPLKDHLGNTYREYLEPVKYNLLLPEIPLIYVDNIDEPDDVIIKRIKRQGTSFKTFLVCDSLYNTKRLTR